MRIGGSQMMLVAAIVVTMCSRLSLHTRVGPVTVVTTWVGSDRKVRLGLNVMMMKLALFMKRTCSSCQEVVIGTLHTWLKCDDDEVSPVHEEDVLKLSGGGDWHTAYLLLYGPRKLPKVRGQPQESSSTPAAAGENT